MQFSKAEQRQSRAVAAIGAGVLALLACLAIAIGLIGCGGSSGSNSGSGETTLRATAVSFPDYLDPALSISLEGVGAMWNSYIPLLTYEHAEGRAGTRLIPGLARALPRISDGGRTYTLFLRKGLRYSDGSAVRASDFEHAIERVLALDSGGSPFFTDIVGAERFAQRKSGGIAGISADDASGRITIHLEQPSGTFSYRLATIYSALVPADAAVEDLTRHPPPASGPYEIVATTPGRGWEYRRNPQWSHNAALLPQLPGGNFERIEVDVLTNPETQVNEVERGQADLMLTPPPTDRLTELRQRYGGTQLLSGPAINIFYFWMNTTRPPFDDVRVRRAVNYALDPAALERIYTGELTPLQQVLPAAMPGHASFGLYPHNLAKARALIAAADPSDRRITIWTNNFGPQLEAGEYYESVLRQLGFETKLKVLDPANYFAVIGNESTPDLDTGWGNWLLDYPHPNDYFEPQLTDAGIAPTNATNWARFDSPAVDREVERLRRQQLGPAQEADYARLDREVMRQAPWAPFGTLSFPTFVSAGIDGGGVIISPIYGVDLTSLQPK
jgi:peptide/nickel transport system substrate-binding protein